MSQESDVSEEDPSVTRVAKAYAEAVAARDIDAFIRLYDPSVRVFDAWGVWSYEGIAAWRVAIANWFASDPNERLKVTFDEVTVVSSPAFASMTAMVTYAMVSAQGEPKNSIRNRLTWVIDTSGPLPRIIHEHTSVPVRFEDGKAILQS